MILGDIPQNKFLNKSHFQTEKKSASERNICMLHREWNLKSLSWTKSPGSVSFAKLNTENNLQLLGIFTKRTLTFLYMLLITWRRSKVGENYPDLC